MSIHLIFVTTVLYIGRKLNQCNSNTVFKKSHFADLGIISNTDYGFIGVPI